MTLNNYAAMALIYIVTGLAISAITSVPGALVSRSTGKHEPATPLGFAITSLLWPLFVVCWMMP